MTNLVHKNRLMMFSHVLKNTTVNPAWLILTSSLKFDNTAVVDQKNVTNYLKMININKSQALLTYVVELLRFVLINLVAFSNISFRPL